MKLQSVWVALTLKAAGGSVLSFPILNFRRDRSPNTQQPKVRCHLMAAILLTALAQTGTPADPAPLFLSPAKATGTAAGTVSITCPPAVQLECGTTSDPSVTGMPVVTTSCGGSVDLTYTDTLLPADCTAEGFDRAWTTTACGHKTASCVQRITFTDTQPPQFVTVLPLEDFVPCGWPVPPPPTAQVIDNCDPNPSVVVTETQIGPDYSGVSGITRTWTVTDQCGNSSSHVELITVDGCIATDTLSAISGTKFYDANANGVQDPGEPGIAGWKMLLVGGPDYVGLSTVTDANGQYVFSGLKEGTYALTAAAPNESTWQDTTAASWIIVLGDTPENRDFGGLCLGAGNGESVTFWTGSAGNRLLNAGQGSHAELALLQQLNLHSDDGSDFDPTSNNQLKTWLAGAQAGKITYQLSAQLAAMALNLQSSLVKGGSQLHAPGAAAANRLGYAAVEALVAEANRELGVHAVIPPSDDGSIQSYQTQLKAALQGANENQAFIQSVPCSATFGP